MAATQSVTLNIPADLYAKAKAAGINMRQTFIAALEASLQAKAPAAGPVDRVHRPGRPEGPQRQAAAPGLGAQKHSPLPPG